MSESQRRRPVGGRARKRAVRALAAENNLPYSVAARWLASPQAGEGDVPAGYGRTVYPPSSDIHRHRLVEGRERRAYTERVLDARLAADLPFGRGRHLADRFPPTRGEPGTRVGPLYHGTGRPDVLALLYAVVARERPEAVPTAGDLAWVAELGEETAVDTACGELDRAARRLLDCGRDALLGRIEAMLAAGAEHPNWRIREESARLAAAYRTGTTPYDRLGDVDAKPGLALPGARHTLDALLVIADDGHAPATRARFLTGPHRGRNGTIVGAVWADAGPPVSYDVHPDTSGHAVRAVPGDLAIVPARPAR
ncbi:hypothetical protein [Actinomadura roseirufa]|uniref:hypothetical protein n=1 Tax=Actinomadura roseirufa TaxID=2094049 RepID=UPI001040E19F|nr:hypothetical protein [Actinomadura roseirufa]